MRSPTRQGIVWLLLLSCSALGVFAQTQTKSNKTTPLGSIAGRVTIKGKGAGGILVGLRTSDYSPMTAPGYRATSDQDGNYRITDVPAGSYLVAPSAPAFVTSGLSDPRGKSLIVTAGENIDGVDFVLTRGGVITGKVTDAENRPLVEELIVLFPADTNQRPAIYNVSQRGVQTDDRGIYRIFGLPAGRYKIAVGQSDDTFSANGRRALYRQTFHPDVTDGAKAIIIEVTEGSETSNVDITVGRALDTFAVSGQIVDGETGKPVPNVRLGLQRFTSERNSPFVGSMSLSSSSGEFRLENLAPGKYAVVLLPMLNSELRADAVPFELIDQDLTGLLVKTAKGASVTGIVVIEGPNDRAVFARLLQMRVAAHVRTEGAGGGFSQSSTLNPDGSFRIGGLQTGLANFSLSSRDYREQRAFVLSRVEHDGVVQPRGVEVKDGEQVTGVRLIFNYGNGTILGVVKVENGELPPTARLTVFLTKPADDRTKPPKTFRPPTQVDSRGHFIIESLAAGTYEVNVSAFVPGSRTRPPSTKQQVTVTDGSVTEVTITLGMNQNPGPTNP